MALNLRQNSSFVFNIQVSFSTFRFPFQMPCLRFRSEFFSTKSPLSNSTLYLVVVISSSKMLGQDSRLNVSLQQSSIRFANQVFASTFNPWFEEASFFFNNQAFASTFKSSLCLCSQPSRSVMCQTTYKF